jgi:hypothetical protein
MRLPLRELSDTRLAALHRAARRSLAGFAQATQAHGSLVQSWVRGTVVQALDHYPDGGLIDRRRGSQLFYHCHRPGGTEHGHVHLFWHATRSGKRRYPGRSRAPGHTGAWVRTAPSHLLAIGLDARGLPVSLFTVNQWVTGGHWFDATTTLGLVRRFQLQQVPGHEASCDWVSGFVRLYEPLIEPLLQARDRRLARAGSLHSALNDKRIEVLSSVNLDWAADLTRLEGELARRGLEQGGHDK